MEGMIASIVASVLSLVGIILTNMASNRKIEQNLAVSQAVTDTKIEELTREVRAHNGFAQKIPAIEAEISNMKDDIAELKRK